MTPSARGEARARRDIAAGKMRILRYGNPLTGADPRVDPESGLRVRILIDCCVTPESRAETAAYNRVMREAAQARRKARTPSPTER